MPFEVIVPKGAPPPLAPYSPGAKAGNAVYVSGTLALDSQGKVVGTFSFGTTLAAQAGDVITSVNGEPVTSASELRRRIQRLDEGAEFTIGVLRDKKPMTLKGKLEPRAERVRTYIS